MTGEQFKTQDALVMVGQTVAGRYSVVEHLGTGGFAKVFKAFDRVIERDVAIKFLDLRGIGGGGSMIQTVLERFRREAKLAAKIPHRNVVNIFDIGQLDEEGFRPFIVMELLHGFDLEDQLTEHGPMRARRLIPLFVDCLDALGQAHALGIVHKDLKPSNLFLSDPSERAESLRIVDFGIAHIKGNSEEDAGEESKGNAKRLTATGQILGTLQYLAPEYIATQTVSPALDVYQMALILIELLSGERVIDTDNAFECLRIHTFGLLEIPEYLLDSELGDVLHKALESDHLVRYQNAREFADALSKVDVNKIPDSPKFAGDAPLATHTLGSTISSPAIKTAPNTANIKRPGTDEMQRGDIAGKMTPTSELEVGAPPVSPGTHHIEADHSSKRTHISREKTKSTALAASVDPTHVHHHHLDEFDDIPAAPKQNLNLILGGVLVLILVAGGALAVIVQSRDSGAMEARAPSSPVITAQEDAPREASARPDAPLVDGASVGAQRELPTSEHALGSVDKPAEDETLVAPPAALDKNTPEEKQEAVVKRSTASASSSKKSLKELPSFVRLDVSPKDATVQVGSKKLSGPSYNVEIPAGDERSALITVSSPGHSPETFYVSSNDSTRKVTLKKKKAPAVEKQPSPTTTRTAPVEKKAEVPAIHSPPKEKKKGMQLMD